jgi:hypothetical protein
MRQYPILRRIGAPALLVAFACIWLAGCGGSKDPVVFEPGEEQQVEFRVSDTQDARSNPERYRALFVEGSAPDDKLMQQHQKYSFYAESVEISGDTATAMVVARDAESGEDKGKVQWKLQRTGDKWLISDAPLP